MLTLQHQAFSISLSLIATRPLRVPDRKPAYAARRSGFRCPDIRADNGESAALFQARIRQCLLAPLAGFLFVLVQAIQQPALAGRHASAVLVEVVAALVYQVGQGGNGPLELGRGVEQGVLALTAELVRMGIQAGQDAAIAGRHALAMDGQFLFAARGHGLDDAFHRGFGGSFLLGGRGSNTGNCDAQHDTD
jgi:hypothetical protein